MAHRFISFFDALFPNYKGTEFLEYHGVPFQTN